MDCNVIKDLLPLYIDKCCSEESSELVEEHLLHCDECKAVLEDMNTIPEVDENTAIPPQKLKSVDSFKASILQSVLLFVSFLLITVGVAYEATTNYDDIFNGALAIYMVVPSTGFMLSLANWYFIPFYKNRKQFSNVSCLLTFTFTLMALLFTTIHYEMLDLYVWGVSLCLVPTAVLCVLSKVLSNVYAKMLGKE